MIERRYVHLSEWAQRRSGGDWEVWISDPVIIAVYDGSYTVWNRQTGERVYHDDHHPEEAIAAAQALIDRWGYEEGEGGYGEAFDTVY